MTHPLLSKKTPYPAPKFHSLNAKKFKEAIKLCMKEANEKIEILKSQEGAPTFQNTFVPFDTLFSNLQQITYILDTYIRTTRSEELNEIKTKLGKKILDLNATVYQDDIIVSRIEELYRVKEALNLDKQDLHFMETVYHNFLLKGAFLPNEGRARLKQIDSDLIELCDKFETNVTKSHITCAVLVKDKGELNGLSPETLVALRENAKKNGYKKGWLAIPSRNQVAGNYLISANDTNFREKIWSAMQKLGSVEGFDNTRIVASIIRLREERAQLLGYANYAQMALKPTMAKTPEAVSDLFNKVAPAVFEAYGEEVKKFQAHAAENGFTGKLMPWDIPYWAKKYQENEFTGVDTNIEPYLELNTVIDGFFRHVENLLDLKLTETDAYPVYHPDVRVFEVRDSATDKMRGLLYADFYARPGEKSVGAWMENIVLSTDDQIPISFIAMNFQKPARGEPTLLNPDACETLYHEGGHALHHILGTKGKYASMKGIAVSADFVEFPSQLMENYFYDADCLRETARHRNTGEGLLQDQIDFIADQGRYSALTTLVTILVNGKRDMFIHTAPSDIATNPENLAQARFNLKGEEYARGAPLNLFAHLFNEPASMYAAGYYSYLWSNMLDADAFGILKKAGIYNKAATLPLKEVFSSGGMIDTADIYRDFAGRDPSCDAMLRRAGIKVAQQPAPI